MLMFFLYLRILVTRNSRTARKRGLRESVEKQSQAIGQTTVLFSRQSRTGLMNMLVLF